VAAETLENGTPFDKNMNDKKNVVTHIKTAKPVTQSQLVMALKNAMGPIFEHFEEKLRESDGQILDIQISVTGCNVALNYGIGKPVSEPVSDPSAR
jgi:hypothetical protein